MAMEGLYSIFFITKPLGCADSSPVNKSPLKFEPTPPPLPFQPNGAFQSFTYEETNWAIKHKLSLPAPDEEADHAQFLGCQLTIAIYYGCLEGSHSRGNIGEVLQGD